MWNIGSPLADANYSNVTPHTQRKIWSKESVEKSVLWTQESVHIIQTGHFLSYKRFEWATEEEFPLHANTQRPAKADSQRGNCITGVLITTPCWQGSLYSSDLCLHTGAQNDRPPRTTGRPSWNPEYVKPRSNLLHLPPPPPSPPLLTSAHTQHSVVHTLSQ